MMERNGLSGRMYSNVGAGGILGLELPLNPPLTQSQNPQIHLQKHPQIVPFIQQQQQHQQQQQQQIEQQTQLSMKQPNFSYNTNSNTKSNTNPPQKPKIQMTQLTNSDEDEPGCSNDHESNSFDGNRKSGNSNSMSPWHRMKWTDNMVRLLIMAVYYIGDEVAGSELGSDKKKPGSGGGGAGGLLQKKGKWKSVSKAMMEKGFYVSPQQCEDKFNDLNKRYKRVNDILGKGTACKVVENQNLLESMDLSPKRKEEVKKLLNSKHLFFKEMCAYHNTCNHGSGGSTGDPVSAPNQTVDIQPDPSLSQQHHSQVLVQQQQQSCLHSAQMQHSNMLHSNSHKVGFGTEEHYDNEDEDEEDDDEDEYNDEEEEHEERRAMKKARTMLTNSAPACQALQQLNGELMGMLQDSNKSPWEKKQWVIRQLVELEEQGVKFQFQALELEKQKLKWLKFSGEKEREMERMKIDNEKKRLENETMMLLLKKQELELLQHHSNHNSHNTY